MKKQVLKLDIEDMNDDGEELAYLFFHTAVPGYAFVDDLNHLYSLSLTRQDDLMMDNRNWPLYTYRDTLRKMDYYLIERPTGNAAVATHWAPGHKMMILKGEKASDIAEYICNDFVSPLPQPDDYNPAATARYDILSSYQQAFTPVNKYDMSTPSSTSKKILKERTELETLFTAILDLLDLSSIN